MDRGAWRATVRGVELGTTEQLTLYHLYIKRLIYECNVSNLCDQRNAI